MSTAEAKRPRGRPRDPMIEPRMYDAAIVVYAERGWYGFSLEAVGRQAGVGQGAMYRRWASKADLLAEAINSRAPVLQPIVAGDTRVQLKQLAQFFLSTYRDAMGVVGLRMVLDARTNPELAEGFDRLLKGVRLAEPRRVVKRAFERGDLRPPTTVDLVLEILTGATLSHVLFRMAPGGAAQRARGDDVFVDRLVDSLLVRPEDRA